jgi:hypothetical protein
MVAGSKAVNVAVGVLVVFRFVKAADDGVIRTTGTPTLIEMLAVAMLPFDELLAIN